MITPLSPLPFVGFTQTLAAPDTLYEAAIAPYNNTQEVLIYNNSDTAIYVAIDNITVVAAILLTGMTLIPARAAISLYIGSEGDRVPMATHAWWLANYPGGGGTGYNLIFQFTGAVADLDVNVTYVQGVGGRAGRDR